MSFLQRFEQLHPASWILLWLSLALALQCLPLPILLGAALITLPLTLWLAGERFRQLLRRTRWLLLSIVLLFAFATPGVALSGWMGASGLTREGLAFAATHTLRLIQLLALLALLLERLGIPALIAGLYVLLGAIGLRRQRGRMALRLLLVLEYVEQGRELRQQGIRTHWQSWFDPHIMSANDGETPQTFAPIELHAAPLASRDRLVMLLSLLGLILAYLSLGSRA
jgi:energy-coupling factor transport system permease protein